MSSDSDDDCYGKIAQKLQSMKSDYNDAKKKAPVLLKDSSDLTVSKDSTTKDSELPAINITEQTDIDLDDSNELTLDSIIAQNTTKRTTRRRSKKNEEYVPDEPVGRVRRRSSRRIARQDRDSLVAHLADVVAKAQAAFDAGTSTGLVGRGSTPSRRRGGRVRARGRGRTRGNSRSTQCHINSFSSNILNFFSVGNTDEYADLSEQQDLFSAKPADVIILDDSLNNTVDDSLDENEELSVKVYWQSCEVFKFPIRRFQKFTQIYDFFMSKETVTREKLLFTYNDRILSENDTPDSINYNIGKFIDGGIVNQSLSPLKKKPRQEVVNGIKLKFQCQNVKRPYETVTEADEKLSVTFIRCAEHFEKPLDKLKFYFDGDLISGKKTAKDLELEGGECIDVVIIR